MRASVRNRVLFSVLCAGLFIIAGCWSFEVGTPNASNASVSTFSKTTATWASTPLGLFYKVQHVVILMMENRAYDNYYGVYCPKTGPNCPSSAKGIPPTLCVPLYPKNASSPCIKPYSDDLGPSTLQGLPDLLHTWTSSHSAYNNGSMNNFYLAEQSQNDTFGHYNGSTIPVYWDMAEEFGLGDDFFSSTLTYSLPNHWYLVAGQAPSIVMGPGYADYRNITADHVYLNEANVTPSIETELLNHPRVSWSYYDFNLSTYAHAVTDLSGNSWGSAYQVWNPLAAPNASYQGSVPDHFKGRNQFFTDLTSGNLSNISYVIPNATFSDHLPANITYGENFVASVVNAVQASSYWNSTAVFVTWDEYGGWYDNVAPPVIDSDGLGFRVPLLVFSPWTAPGYVGTHQLSFDSLLAFLEWRWGLGCLTNRDCTASLPFGFFNFNIHRNPTYFGNASSSVYPYVAPTGPPYIENATQLNSLGLDIPPQDRAFIDWT